MSTFTAVHLIIALVNEIEFLRDNRPHTPKSTGKYTYTVPECPYAELYVNGSVIKTALVTLSVKNDLFAYLLVSRKAGFNY